MYRMAKKVGMDGELRIFPTDRFKVKFQLSWGIALMVSVNRIDDVES